MQERVERGRSEGEGGEGKEWRRGWRGEGVPGFQFTFNPSPTGGILKYPFINVRLLDTCG